jgi:hypothetical protein
MSNPYTSQRQDESHIPPRQMPKATEASEYLCGGESSIWRQALPSVAPPR